MLTNRLRILNFDKSILKQEKLLAQYANEVIDLTDLGPLARHWVNTKSRSLIAKRIINSTKNSVTFLGSGDFHHLSSILISQFTEPISVIVFDLHPDWSVFSPRLACGSWVNEVLRKKNILKLILIGVSSCDISTFDIQGGNLNLLKDNQLEIYPYAHQPSFVFFRKIAQNLSLEIKRGLFCSKIYWHELKERNLPEFFQGLFKRIPTKEVYVSIDKDCLKNDYALTNWGEGRFSLDELLLILKIIKENLDIAGLDIVGDYSEGSLKGLVKKIAAYFDHPKDIKAKKLAESVITGVNEATNLKILETLNS